MIDYSVRQSCPYYQEFVYLNGELIGDIYEFPILGHYLVTVQTNSNPLSTCVQRHKTIAQAKEYIEQLLTGIE